MTTTSENLRYAALHAYGYEGEVEQHVAVRELYRATCDLCGWEGDEHDEMAWKDAEEEAVEHYAECPARDHDDDEGES